LQVLLFPLPIEWNLNCKRDHFTSDVGTEELSHLEMIGAIVYQLTRNLSEEDIKKHGFDAYFVDHTAGVYPSSAAGIPFTAAYIQSKGNVITDMSENLAAEQKARTTYDNILRLATDKLDKKNFYAFNPSFDKHCNK